MAKVSNVFLETHQAEEYAAARTPDGERLRLKGSEAGLLCNPRGQS